MAGWGDSTRERRDAGRLRKLIAAIVAPLLTIALVVGITAPAQAAGDAQLLVTVTAVDASTGAPITSIASTNSPRRIAFRVDFSCVTQNCDNATVKFDPMALDPNYNFYRLLNRTGFTPPLSGGSVTGSDAAGWTVNLGNLAAGASGQFRLEYGWPALGFSGPTPERADFPYAIFPNGYPITTTVRGNADTAVGERTSTSAPVTWGVATPNPTTSTNFAAPTAGFFTTDTNYTYRVSMASGCKNESNLFTYDFQCASDYLVTHRLPPGAELVSAEGVYTVSGDVATGLVITWDAPTWAPTGNTAMPGWAGNPHDVTIRFPRANLAPPGQSCNYTTQFSGPSGRVDVTYISMPGTPGEQKSATFAPGGPFQLRCVDPFPRAAADPKTSTMDATTRDPANVSRVSIPATGENLKEWQVTVANTSNIPGVAVVTDNTLDQQDLPVYQIVAPAGSTIAWTATNGTTTVSGTSTGTANAPAGFRFATSTVTSPTLAAPNQAPTDTGRTTFTVRYLYRVTPDATPGARRTNTASAVMQWPNNPEFASTNLTIPSHTVELVAPFARWTSSKRVTWLREGASSGGNGPDTPIPGAGSFTTFYWNVLVSNTGSAPGIPRIVEPNLDDPDMHVTRLQTKIINPGQDFSSASRVTSTFEYTLDDGTTGTFTGGLLNAPAGRYFVAVTATGPELAGANRVPEQTASRSYHLEMAGRILPTAVPDSVHVNNAQTSLDPSNYGFAPLTGTASATAHLVGQSLTITATMGAPVIAGGASQATTTTDVTYTVCGSTANVPLNRDVTPEYVFMAPVGWNITQGSASFPAGSVPAGVSFQYRTVTISGVSRQVVVASWPAGTVFGENRSLPCMSVVARPSASAPAGSVGIARGFIGNTNSPQTGDTFTREFTDTPNIDGNASTIRFSESAPPAGVPVAAVGAMQVLKEICFPDSTRPDGCRWFSDPNNTVGVPPNATSIKYRISVTNTGNTPLSDVVGYDVLPYVGDTGTSDATGSTPRGSTFRETIQTATTPTNGAVATFSGSTQPCRSEVDATVPSCVNDWSSTSAGAQAIRLAKTGTLAAGESFSMEYTAAVNNAPGFGAIACNSFAVRATGLANVSEPAPVCASVEETDLGVTAGTPQLQSGRPGVLPWTVTNHGGAPSTMARVTIDIPAGLEVTSFTPDGWTCTAVDAAGEPVFGTAVGIAVLTCESNTALQKDVPRALNVPVRPTTTANLVSTAEVTGRLFDGNEPNNTAEMSLTATDPAGDIGVTKTDGVTTARPGDLLTYTITVTNPLDFETLKGATLTDTLPGRVTFVSASNGGTVDSGVVTWALPDMPGQGTLTRTVTVRVTSTINTAELVNTARVTAPDPASPSQQLTGSAEDRDQVVTRPELTVSKASTTATITAVDQQVPYTFTVTNTGDVTLSALSVTDTVTAPSTQSRLSAVTCPVSVLAPAASTTCTATYRVTQADLDHGSVADVVVANAVDPAAHAVASAPDDLSIPVVQTPSMNLAKASTTTEITAAGQSVPYTFTVTNTGNVTLTDVSVTDAVVAPSTPGNLSAVMCPDEPLAPGASMVCAATYVVTQVDVDHGVVGDRATASGTSPRGVGVVSPTRALEIPVVSAPAIEILKASPLEEVTRAGQEIPYTFTVTNTGNVTLSDIRVTDVVAAPSLPANLTAVSCPETTLAPGEDTTCTATYTVTQADIDHGSVSDAATATGTPPATAATPDPQPVTSPPSPLTIPVTQDPSISVVKSSPDLDVPIATVGQVVRYSFAVRNTGNTTLTDVVVEDVVAAPSLPANLSEIVCPAVDSLAPNATITCTATYTVAQADVDNGDVTDTATARGRDPEGTEVVSDPSTLSIPADPNPGIDLIKGSVQATYAAVGDVVEYTFEAINTGNVTLHDVEITDLMDGLSDLTVTWPAAEGVLVPGESATATATYTVTQEDIDNGRIDNRATVTADPPTGPGVDDEDTHRVVSAAVPHLTTTKTADGAIARAGDVITYTVTVLNDGAVTLHDVAIADPLEGLSSLTYEWPGVEGILAPGDSVTATATYRVTQADVDAGQVHNTATGTGHTQTGVDLSDDDSVTVPIDPTPSLDLVKRGAYAPGQRGEAGDTITYTFTVENTGNVTLSSVSIADQLVGLSAISYIWPGDEGVLAPGQIATATATYTVTQADVDSELGVINDATATGNPPVGDPVSDEDSVVMETPADSGIQIVKTAVLDGSDPVAPGDTVRYRFEATNLGTLTLEGVTLTDPMGGLSDLTLTWPGEEGVLFPGETLIGEAEYHLTQADIDLGHVANTATTQGQTRTGVPVTDDDTATVVLPPQTGITLDKTASAPAGEWTAGMTVTYRFTVTNTGNVTEEDVRITDPMPGLSQIEMTWPGEPGVLAPGQSATGTATYALTAQDVRNAELANTATVTTRRGTQAEDSVTLVAPPVAPGFAGLAFTGGGGGLGIAVAGGVLLLGGLVILITRRRRHARNS